MTGRIIFGFCVACFLCTCLALFALVNRAKTVAAGFIGFEDGMDFCQALVALTNKSRLTARFESLVSCSRLDKKQNIEVGRPVNMVMTARSAGVVGVTVPFGPGPARVSCSINVVGQHSGLVRRLAASLQRIGIHVYHCAPASPSTGTPAIARPTRSAYAFGRWSSIRIQIGGKKPAASLSDWLLFQQYTNCWTLP